MNPAPTCCPAARSGCAAALALSLLLGACSVGPRFSRPSVPQTSAHLAPAEIENRAPEPGSAPVPDRFAQNLVLGGEQSLEWWTEFHSPALDALVSRAIAHNHSLAAAQEAVAQAREAVVSAYAAHYPQLTGNLGAGRQKLGAQFLGPFHIPPFSYVAFGAAASYSIDYLGTVGRQVEQRRARAQYQQAEASLAWLNLTGAVVTQAVAIASARAQIAALTELLAEDRDNLNLVQTAFQNGSVSKLDVLTAQSQLASDETLIAPLRQQLSVARHALAVLLGEAPALWSAPDFDLGELTLPRQVPVSLPSQLVHRRPDILAAEAELSASTQAVGIATANLYPQITLSATGGLEAQQASQLFNASSAAWSLISGLTTPIFDGGRLHAERRAAVDAMHADAERYQPVVLESFGQVADLLDALAHDSQLLAAQANALSTAQNSVDLARESYSAGYSGVLQVIDAQRLRLEAQLGFVRAQAQQFLDTVQLSLALGGGPSVSAPEVAARSSPVTGSIR